MAQMIDLVAIGRIQHLGLLQQGPERLQTGPRTGFLIIGGIVERFYVEHGNPVLIGLRSGQPGGKTQPDCLDCTHLKFLSTQNTQLNNGYCFI